MDFFVVSIVALFVSTLTLFSGFGLGTLLMPAFALFFPVPVAVGATALVHLANNMFKIVLVGRKADRRVVLRFALPAAGAAFAGAWLLEGLSAAVPLFTYSLGERLIEVTPVHLVMGFLIVGFAALELMPRFESLAFPATFIPLGGVLSGFFGGLSGHQGALRSAFLIRAGLSKEAFVGTMVVSAVVVDLVRLAVYGTTFLGNSLEFVSRDGTSGWSLVAAGTAAAFAGSMIGTRLVKKITMKTIRTIVGVMLLFLGLAIGAGVV